MFLELVNHNDDLRRLVERGYAVAIDSLCYLVVRDIPYLDQDLNLKVGAIVTKFTDIGQNCIRQDDHQVFFAGSVPYGLDGRPIPNLAGGPTTLALGESSKDVVVQRSFSNKPTETGKFKDFFHKIESYVAIISGPAIEKYRTSPLTFRAVENDSFDSPFRIRDTLTSRAEIGDLVEKLKNDVIAIVGLGGTGSYLLDFLVKTPVREIRAFDHDRYYVHNAFRSPGALKLDEIGKYKADVYQSRYDSFRTRLFVKQMYLDSSSNENLNGVTFAFVCVDRGSARAGIFDQLISRRIPFIDVGMGLKRRSQEPIGGMLRVTYFAGEDGQTTREKNLADLSDTPDDIYQNNIQIAELNALNASLAVVRFKQLRGYYREELSRENLLVSVGNLKSYGDPETESN